MKTTGQLLKEHREKSGLTHAEVSLSTKISVRMLKALEAGDLQTLPAPSFIRGFVRSYASYLKLDPDELVKMFNEEMAPPPAPPPEGQVDPNSTASSESVIATSSTAPEKSPSPSEELTSQDILNAKPSVLKKLGMGFAVLGLIALIFFVFQTVKKYEREGVVEDVPEVAQIDETDEDSSEEATPTAQDEVTNSESLSANAPKSPEPEEPKTVEASKPEPVVAKSPEPSATPDVSPASSPQPESNPVTPQSPEAPKVAEPPKAAEVVKSEAPKPDSEPAKPSARAEAKSMSQEIIVEALDKVEITLRPASGQKQTMKLAPGAIHALRVEGALEMDLSDGGVVNIIHNGKDLGVVGDLGQPKRLTLP